MFVREKTNYKSILYKTFYVSCSGAGGCCSWEGCPSCPKTVALRRGGWAPQPACTAQGAGSCSIQPCVPVCARCAGYARKVGGLAGRQQASATAPQPPPPCLASSPLAVDVDLPHLPHPPACPAQQVLEYAATTYDAAFVLKTDDDAFINVAPLVAQLRAMCEHKDCRRERLYMGKMAQHSEVLLQPGHKWNNAAFHNHTGGCAGCREGWQRGEGAGAGPSGWGDGGGLGCLGALEGQGSRWQLNGRALRLTIANGSPLPRSLPPSLPAPAGRLCLPHHPPPPGVPGLCSTFR